MKSQKSFVSNSWKSITEIKIQFSERKNNNFSRQESFYFPVILRLNNQLSWILQELCSVFSGLHSQSLIFYCDISQQNFEQILPQKNISNTPSKCSWHNSVSGASETMPGLCSSPVRPHPQVNNEMKNKKTPAGKK